MTEIEVIAKTLAKAVRIWPNSPDHMRPAFIALGQTLMQLPVGQIAEAMRDFADRLDKELSEQQ